MSAITIDGDLIHYEKLGRGRPVILVHGWVGSWRYWIPVMQQLHLKFKVYTLDLLGFGDSAKNPKRYDIPSQVAMLDQFMEQLGITKAAFLGHGLGTIVLTQYALKNPTKVARMMLTSIPLYDPGNLAQRTPAGTRRLLTPSNKRYSMAPSLEDVGESGSSNNSDKTVANSGQNADKTLLSGGGFNEMPTIQRPDSENIDRDRLRQAAEERRRKKQRQNPLNEQFKDTTLLSLLDDCFSKNEPEYDKLKVDVDKADDRVLTRTTENYDSGEMLDDLRRVTAPIVAVHGEDDPVLDAPDEAIWNYLTVEKEDVFVPIVLPDIRHFPMLEHNAYSRLVGDFLSTADLSTLEVRERWRRRSR